MKNSMMGITSSGLCFADQTESLKIGKVSNSERLWGRKASKQIHWAHSFGPGPGPIWAHSFGPGPIGPIWTHHHITTALLNILILWSDNKIRRNKNAQGTMTPAPKSLARVGLFCCSALFLDKFSNTNVNFSHTL